MPVICCTRDRRSLRKSTSDAADDLMVAIDQDGLCNPVLAKDPKKAIYYSEIQFAGTCEPLSGKKGLDLLPNTIVYNGLVLGLFESFAHFQSEKHLHAYAALFIEAGAVLTFQGSEINVSGKGSVTVFRSKKFDQGELDFEFFNYIQGEKIRLVGSGVKI